MAHQNQHNVLILDIEGSDSRERWEGKTMYERTTALFGLVMSNLLIINLWTQVIFLLMFNNNRKLVGSQLLIMKS